MSRLRAAFLSEVRDTWHAQQRVASAVFYVLLHVGIALAVAIASQSMLDWNRWIGLLFLPIAIFAIGSRFRALGNMVHECSHGVFVRSPRGNRIFGHFLAAFDFTAFQDYVREHQSHHRYLGDPDKDMDFAVRRDLFARPGSYVRVHVLKPLSLVHVPRYVRPILVSRSDSLATALFRLGFCGGLACVAHLGVGWGPFALYYLVPYATAYQVFRYWSDAADHGSATSERDEFFRSRNHLLPPVLSAVFFPRNDGYHLVHHLFPRVPVKHMPAVHRRLMEDLAYASRPHAFLASVRGRAASAGSSRPSAGTGIGR